MSAREECPVTGFDRAGADYPQLVADWLANPHAYFTAFGREAREFQRRHRSERLRTMTLVAPTEELAGFRPVCMCVDGAEERTNSWENLFARVILRLAAANPAVFDALQTAGELVWLGCEPGGMALAAQLETGALRPGFGGLDEVVGRIQWLFLMCGIRLNEVIVQVDPYTDEEWRVRKDQIDQRRAADKAFMEGRRAAQKAWAETHPEEMQGIFA